MQITDCSAYEVLQKERIEDVHADGYLLRHKKTGARVALLSNDDENKVFNPGYCFATDGWLYTGEQRSETSGRRRGYGYSFAEKI